MVLSLGITAHLASSTPLVRLWPAALLLPAMLLVAWLSSGWGRQQPPATALHYLLQRGLTAVRRKEQQLTASYLPRWRASLQSWVKQFWNAVELDQLIESVARRINHWQTVLLILLLLGILIAWQGVYG